MHSLYYHALFKALYSFNLIYSFEPKVLKTFVSCFVTSRTKSIGKGASNTFPNFSKLRTIFQFLSQFVKFDPVRMLLSKICNKMLLTIFNYHNLKENLKSKLNLLVSCQPKHLIN